ncbi:DUF1697 domain-containing protein [Acidaminobacter sp. JC074]|uniref:DUF1697 domain-containing protein n=1 Tax=Acidaminobacter sp. JC074 TaxID=2530199 RepID=UPI001F0F1082|nr:DUF1697 domain-containing protein [Acidaminobacter sp. JC074]MCH4888124.1 DUF1697 domain-containing protein [Acidaminobacter sp. JC074]
MKVAFLRGINVSGKNKVDMKSLKTLLEDFGLSHVKTYLNTGNVIFDGHISLGEFEGLIEKNFGISIHVIIKESDELKAYSDNYHLSDGDKNAYITLFDRPVDGYESLIDEKKKDDEVYEIKKDHFYFYAPSGYGKTKISNNFLEKKLDRTATTRNIKTIRKIIDLMD